MRHSAVVVIAHCPSRGVQYPSVLQRFVRLQSFGSRAAQLPSVKEHRPCSLQGVDRRQSCAEATTHEPSFAVQCPVPLQPSLARQSRFEPAVHSAFLREQRPSCLQPDDALQLWPSAGPQGLSPTIEVLKLPTVRPAFGAPDQDLTPRGRASSRYL